MGCCTEDCELIFEAPNLKESMKCCANDCEQKAEIVLKKLRTQEKTPYCKFHWKMLCLQETVKFFKMNEFSLEDFGKMVDKNIKLQDFFSHLTKH